MYDSNFHIEKIRFHLIDKKKLIIVGWFKQDNKDNREIRVTADDVNLSYETKINKGIEVRDRYSMYNLDITKEFVLIVDLPEDFEKYNKLTIYTDYNGESFISKEKKISKIISEDKEIDYYIEREEYKDGELIISGWFLATGEVKIFLLNSNGEKLEADVSRSSRRDVLDGLFESEENIKPGFCLKAKTEDGQKFILCFEAGDRKAQYKVILNHTKKSIAVNQKRNLLTKGIRYLKKNGLKEFTKRFMVKYFNATEIAYNKWRLNTLPSTEELEEQKKTSFSINPKFSFVMPAYNTPINFLKEMIDSIINQTYTNWELCIADGGGSQSTIKSVLEEYSSKDKRIRFVTLDENKGISVNTNAALKMVTGDYIVLVDHDDTIPEFALYECVKRINENPDIDVIYSDEDKVDTNGKTYFEPHFKPDFNIDLLCSVNYICHLFLVKKTIVDTVGEFRQEFDGAQDYDFIFRCCEEAKNICHIPTVLYHWRCHMNSTSSNPESKLYAFEAGKRAIQAHYDRMGIPAKAEHAHAFGMYKTEYMWDEQPLVSIVIPNKDHIEDLDKCIMSIINKSIYRNYEFIIVENNSTDEKTFEYYKKIESEYECIKVVYYSGDFNFSKINNYGVQFANGDYLLLLNNDTEIINEDCIKQLLDYCMREDVGIVGAKLLYADDTIQHAGVVIGFGGIAGHAFIGEHKDSYGYFSRAVVAQDYSAVTAACMMVKRSVFDDVGGLDENLKVAFNDIDFCLRVRKTGKLVVYNPFATLYHFESKSRGAEDTHTKVERFNSEIATFESRWDDILTNGDPYYNVNLSLDRADFALKKQMREG